MARPFRISWNKDVLLQKVIEKAIADAPEWPGTIYFDLQKQKSFEMHYLSATGIFGLDCQKG